MDDWTDGAATFGDRMAFAREQTGLSQAQLARRLGLKAETVRNWEQDRSEPRANRLQMLAGVLGVSIVWLLTGEGEGAPVPLSEEQKDAEPILSEIRELRVTHLRAAERLAIIERRLRERL